MTATEMARLIGLFGFLPIKGKGDLKARVEVLDVKDGGWGRTFVKVAPVNGLGTEWRDLDYISQLSSLPL